MPHTQTHTGGPLPGALASRRPQAMAPELAGDTREARGRELGGSTRWRSTWRERAQRDDPAWVQEPTRRPSSHPRHPPDPMAAAIVHLGRTLGAQGTGRTSAATLWQAVKAQALPPLPSRRTISRI